MNLYIRAYHDQEQQAKENNNQEMKQSKISGIIYTYHIYSQMLYIYIY